MADSFGRGFPSNGIQYGHIHYDEKNLRLYVYIGGDPRYEESWSLVWGIAKEPIDTERWGTQQSGSTWFDVKTKKMRIWNGEHVLDRITVSEFPAVKKKSFKLFDATLYANKPANLPLEKTLLIGGPSLWSIGQNNLELPTQANVNNIVTSVNALPNNALAIINVEHWPIYTDSTFVTKFVDLFNMFYAVAPNINLGLYSMVPRRDYWRAVENTSSVTFQQWQQENDMLMTMAGALRMLLPSVYTFYEDRLGWKLYAERNISEARRYRGNLPVYAFMWPQYHDSNVTLRGQFLPSDYWYQQLSWLRNIADGVVIWGGWDNGPMQWDNEAQWWIATKEFMRTL